MSDSKKTTLVRIDRKLNKELSEIFPGVPKSYLIRKMYDTSVLKDEVFLRKLRGKRR